MKHISVLLEESIKGLNIKEDGVYVDGTLGRGGHSREILKYLDQGCLYSIDKDQAALDAIIDTNESWKLIKGDFRDLKKLLAQEGISTVDGILLDIGVSSPQFDDAERGFSYRYDAPLDMRMDQNQTLSAYEVVNQYSEQDLADVIFQYGEERYAKRIAKNIVKARQSRPISTTFELVDIIKSSLPARELQKKGHPAKQTFQAIRIEVNQELDALKQVIQDGAKLLAPGGRLAIITFHSLEDRIVKHMFRKLSQGPKIDSRIPLLPDQIPKSDFRLVNRKVITANQKELENNRRSKSAKLRIIERKEVENGKDH